MKNTYDIEAIAYQLLKDNQTLTSELSGNISFDRNLNSKKEDIVIKTITFTQEFKPQIGVSNINIHVPDRSVNIGGVPQSVENRARLNTLSKLVLSIVREAHVKGLSIVVESQTTLKEPEISQHFVNIRINWTVH